MELLKKNIVLSVILLLVTFGGYHQVLRNDFVDIDDPKLILNNRAVSDPSTPIARCLQWNLYRAHYKPVTALTWRMEYMLVGDKPFLYHLNNLLLHIANVILVFFIGLKLLRKFFEERNKIQLGAFIFALLFSLHPLHVESVAWAVERKDVLFSFFYLGGWLTYLEYLQKKKYIWLLVTAILYFLSMMSKSMGITLLAVLFLTDILYKRKINFKLLIEKIPVFAIFLVSLHLFGLLFDFSSKDTAGLTFVAESHQASNFETLNLFTPLVRRIVTIFLRFSFWLGHVFVPIKCALIYPKKDILDFFGKGLLIFPFLIGAIYLTAFFLRKKVPEVLWGLLFFGATISPAIAISDSGTAVFLPDRYLYIPLTGVIFFLTVIAIKLYSKNKNLVLIAVGIVTIWFAILTYKQVKVWENTGTLWTRVIDLFSCNAEVINARANYYKNIGETEKAIADLNDAISCDSTLPQPYYGRAMYNFNSRNYANAVNDFNNYVKYKRSGFNAEVFSNRGAAYFSIGEVEKALVDYERAIQLDSNFVNVYQNRAIAYKSLKKHNEAIGDWSKLIGFRPDNMPYYVERGDAYFASSKFKKAINDYSKAIELKPKNGGIYFKRSYAYYRSKSFTEARNDAIKAKELGMKMPARYLKALRINT